MNYTNKTLIACFTSLLLLNGCGGGSSDIPPPAITPPETPPTSAENLTIAFGNYLTVLSNEHIIPRYTALANRAQSMQTASATFCAISTPQHEDLTTVQDAWKSLNSAWQGIQWVKIGEVLEDNNVFRLQFWPDTNDAVYRGVSNLLIEPNTVTGADVARQNVGGQGIPALEFLLYPDNQSDSLTTATDRVKRCEALTAIAQNVTAITITIQKDWSASGNNYADSLINGTGDFTSVKDSVEELVTNWLEHLENVKDEKILFPLGGQAPGVLDITEHFRSDVSLDSIETNLLTFKALYTNGDQTGLDNILRDTVSQTEIASQMLNALDAAIAEITDLQQNFNSYEAALNDTQGRAQLTAIVEDIRAIRDVLSTGFIQALDINIGFNSNDGD
ncbi:MAG: putative lipoprotein [Alphaproteobacteria bacterium]|jgi:predicted lipoprotein